LKLYAYLYNEENGKFPNSLTLVDLYRNEYAIGFNNEECKALAEEAKHILHQVNHQVDQDLKGELATPSNNNCKFCLYKPACEFHWNLEEDGESILTNIRGELSGMKKFTNGNININITNNNKELIISQISSVFEEELSRLLSSKIEFYNLIRTNEHGRYRSIKTTFFYEG
jgi:hypothetical protein